VYTVIPDHTSPSRARVIRVAVSSEKARRRRTERGTAAGLAAILLVIAALFAAIDMAAVHRELSRMTQPQVTAVREPPTSSKSEPSPTSTPAR
jgi:hypothetical protein